MSGWCRSRLLLVSKVPASTQPGGKEKGQVKLQLALLSLTRVYGPSAERLVRSTGQNKISRLAIRAWVNCLILARFEAARTLTQASTLRLSLNAALGAGPTSLWRCWKTS